jgi:hypothetical protein
MSVKPLLAELLDLELRLLHGDPAEAESLLADDFREVHAGGGLASREEVLAWLHAKGTAARWELSDFTVQELGPGLCLCTYHARQVAPRPSTSQGARHASLWQQGAAGWQLRFHQATRVGDATSA